MRQKNNQLLFVLSIILFASCTPKEDITIHGNWEVVTIMDQSNFQPAPNFVINLETMKVAGFSGCNRFFGSITTQKNSLTFHAMGGTRMACPDVTAENLFITTIPKVTSFAFQYNRLQFLSESDEVIMTLKSIEMQ
jgi:heat shock protein HslJ